jgi:DNA-binding transcriptional LysR family regulator
VSSPLRLPSLEALRAFEAAARLGSFEGAADELAVTASAISKRVATLEELVGQPLFQRSPKALLTTAAGKEYLQQVAPVLGLLAAMPQHRRSAARTRRLRLNTPPTFARQVLVPRLEDFVREHPDIDLEVVLSIPHLDHSGPESDLEVRHGPPGLGAVLLHDRVLPMASRSLLQRLPPLRTPADLAQAPLLRTPIEPWAPWFRAAGLPWPEPHSGVRLVDLGLTLEAAVLGQGVALGRPTLAAHWLRAGTLVMPFALHAEPAQRYQLLVHASLPEAQQLGAWLLQVCGALERDANSLLPAQLSGPT